MLPRRLPPVLVLLFLLTFASPVLAQDSPGPAGIVQIQQLLQRLINLITEAGFIAMLIMLLWGGIKFITSGGDTKSIQEARMILVWALVGIMFLVIAWLVLLMIKGITGVNVTEFCLQFSGC